MYVVESEDKERAVMKQVDLNKISEEARMDVFKEAKRLEDTVGREEDNREIIKTRS